MLSANAEDPAPTRTAGHMSAARTTRSCRGAATESHHANPRDLLGLAELGFRIRYQVMAPDVPRPWFSLARTDLVRTSRAILSPIPGGGAGVVSMIPDFTRLPKCGWLQSISISRT